MNNLITTKMLTDIITGRRIGDIHLKVNADTITISPRNDVKVTIFNLKEWRKELQAALIKEK